LTKKKIPVNTAQKPSKKTISIFQDEHKYFVFIVMGVFLVFVFLFTTFKIADDDFFWHLATGRYIVENGVIPGTDVFGELTQNVKWIPFEWGWDVFSYLLYQIGGFNLILIFRSIALVFIFWFIFRLLNKFRVNSIVSLIVLASLIVAMMDRLTPRPHVITYLFFIVLINILVSAKYLERNKYYKYLFFLPLIFLIWGNFHPGVLAGGLILFIFTVSETLVYLFPDKLTSSGITALNKDQLIKLWVISIASALVLLINPHGIQTYIYTYGHTNMKMLEYIKEWRSPFDPEVGYSFINLLFKIFLFGGFLILIYAYIRKDIFVAIIYIGFVLYSIRAIRFMIDYEIIIAFFLALSLDYFINLLKQKNSFNKFISFVLYNNIVKIAVVLGMIFVMYNIPDGSLYVKIMRYYRIFGLGVDNAYMPVQLMDFVKENNISGKAYNYFESGGILVWSIPGQKNFIDSRNLNDDIYFEYRSIMTKGAGFADKIEKYGFDFIIYVDPDLIRRPQTLQSNIISYFSDNPNWKLVYWDDRSFLFLKNEERYAELIKKYEYKILNLYDYVGNQQLFNSRVKSNPELAKYELERKFYSEPNGAIYQNMKNQITKILNPSVK
jgi:hypothetical protein